MLDILAMESMAESMTTSEIQREPLPMRRKQRHAI